MEKQVEVDKVDDNIVEVPLTRTSQNANYPLWVFISDLLWLIRMELNYIYVLCDPF